ERVSVTGRAELVDDIARPFLIDWSGSAERASSLQAFGCHALVGAPLVARGHMVGSFVIARPKAARPLERDDLAVIQELGRRAGLALDNIRLYEAEHHARRDAELALAALEKKDDHLQAILDHAPTSIYIKDLEGRLRVVNRQWEESMKVSRDEAYGKTAYD